MKNKKLCIVLFMLVAGVPFAHAYRDLETGTFLTRDPIGYSDGPNIYCYVHCNPITQFDPLGLYVAAEHDDESNTTTFTIQASVVFEDERLNEKNDDGSFKYQDEREQYRQQIEDSIIQSYNGSEGNHKWTTTKKGEDGKTASTVDITICGSASEVPENNHIIIVTTSGAAGEKNARGRAEKGGGMTKIFTDKMTGRTAGHEVMHFFGLKDNVGLRDGPNDHNLSDSPGTATDLSSKMVRQMVKNYKTDGAINNYLGPRSDTSRYLRSNLKALKEAAIHWRPCVIDGEGYSEPNYNYTEW